MSLTIREKADTLGTYRFVSVFLMETLARWVPTTPELEVKTLFGQHIWDFAQHADELGKRTADLRAPVQYSCKPTAPGLQALETLAGATGTAQRVTGLYDAALPDLERRYRAYLADADHLLDQPTVRILDRLVRDLVRMRADRDDVRRELAGTVLEDGKWRQQLTGLLEGADPIVDHRAPAGAGAEGP